MKRKINIDLSYKDNMGMYTLILSTVKSSNKRFLIALFRSFTYPLVKQIREMLDEIDTR